jgi:two-component system, NarL family, sensor histidine kinase UhpB
MAVSLGTIMRYIAKDFGQQYARVVEDEHERFYEWIHSAVLGQLPSFYRSLRSGLLPPMEAADELERLEDRIRKERIDMRIRSTAIPAADLVAETIRTFELALNFASVPSMAGINFEPATASVVQQILRDLLSNVVRHADPNTVPAVFLAAECEAGIMTISCTDSGTGFPAGFTLRPGTNLARLSLTLQRIGGQLLLPNPNTTPNTVRAVVPLLGDR